MPDIIKVSANSVTTAVAGAIAGVIRDHGGAAVQAIGASAVNQAVKAIAIAHGYLEEEDVSIVCVPGFVEVDINGQERTAIRFDVEVLEEVFDEDEDYDHEDYDEEGEAEDEDEDDGPRRDQPASGASGAASPGAVGLARGAGPQDGPPTRDPAPSDGYAIER